VKVTRQIAADQIADYLHGKLSQAELVDRAERAMMDSDFDEADTEVLAEIIGRLGLADVAEYGLRWQDCEEFLRRLGYRATVTVSSERG
jgi:predicted DsbA family dithiol-disulfide isomerase